MPRPSIDARCVGRDLPDVSAAVPCTCAVANWFVPSARTQPCLHESKYSSKSTGQYTDTAVDIPVAATVNPALSDEKEGGHLALIGGNKERELSKYAVQGFSQGRKDQGMKYCSIVARFDAKYSRRKCTETQRLPERQGKAAWR